MEKGGRRGPRNDSRPVALSKLLSFILRHGAAKEGIKISPEGYVLVDDLLQHRQFKSANYTVDEIIKAVETSDKKRFALRENEMKKLEIKANQGHTVQVEALELKPILLSDVSKYPVVVHGTYDTAWNLIKKGGLSKMKRNHIHLAAGEYGSANVISGMRGNCNLLIYVDMEQAIKDGIAFFESPNGVILTDGINGVLPPKYFSHVLKAPGFQPFDSDFPTIRG
eukprot:TRINITY_DN8829_c0_g1_i1.p1 TRINITY_DN8829_c0_g1~~TRINITY_DN8829_c0_g1_i1.p1  ORF type:complete len:224 (+),score=36.21 TRINITY_DN8829_c0_g1_i1:107-778(+)